MRDLDILDFNFSKGEMAKLIYVTDEGEDDFETVQIISKSNLDDGSYYRVITEEGNTHKILTVSADELFPVTY